MLVECRQLLTHIGAASIRLFRPEPYIREAVRALRIDQQIIGDQALKLIAQITVGLRGLAELEKNVVDGSHGYAVGFPCCASGSTPAARNWASRR
jgi:hypothetical protein